VVLHERMEVRYPPELECWCLQPITMVSLRYLRLRSGPKWSYQFGTIYALYTDDLEHIFHHNYSIVGVGVVLGKVP
jgi:hypothetical protein